MSSEYRATIKKFRRFRVDEIDDEDDHSKHKVPMSYLCDIVIKRVSEGVVVEDLPFQLIGLRLSEVPEDFAELVISGFDLSCVRFAIESPDHPCNVRCLNDKCLNLFKELSFTCDMKKFRGSGTMFSRMKKYMSRGFSLVGLEFKEMIYIGFASGALVDESTSDKFDGSHGKVSYVYDLVRVNPMRSIQCIVNADSLITRDQLRCGSNDLFVHERRKKRLLQRIKAKEALLKTYSRYIGDLRFYVPDPHFDIAIRNCKKSVHYSGVARHRSLSV